MNKAACYFTLATCAHIVAVAMYKHYLDSLLDIIGKKQKRVSVTKMSEVDLPKKRGKKPCTRRKALLKSSTKCFKTMLDEAGSENRKCCIDVCYRRKRSSKPSQSTTGSTSLSFTKPSQSTTGSTSLSFTTPSQSTTGSTSLSFTTPSQSTTGSDSLSFTTPSQSTTGSTSLSFTTPSQSTTGSTSLSFTTRAPSVAASLSAGNSYQAMQMHSPVPPPFVSTPALTRPPPLLQPQMPQSHVNAPMQVTSPFFYAPLYLTGQSPSAGSSREREDPFYLIFVKGNISRCTGCKMRNLQTPQGVPHQP